jgi:hypothetical protein
MEGGEDVDQIGFTVGEAKIADHSRAKLTGEFGTSNLATSHRTGKSYNHF